MESRWMVVVVAAPLSDAVLFMTGLGSPTVILMPSIIAQQWHC